MSYVHLYVARGQPATKFVDEVAGKKITIRQPGARWFKDKRVEQEQALDFVRSLLAARALRLRTR